jgi:hypothetical protein
VSDAAADASVEPATSDLAAAFEAAAEADPPA